MCVFKKKKAVEAPLPVEEENQPDTDTANRAEELRSALFSVDMVPIAPPKDLSAMKPAVSPEEFTVYRNK